jgi:choline dehydrogenase-like flavoprotein
VWGYERSVDGTYCRRTLRIDEDVQRREGLLNFRATLDVGDVSDARHGSSVLSALYLAKRFFIRRIPPEYSVTLSALTQHHQIRRHIWNCVRGLPGLVAFSGKFVFLRLLAERKLPSLVLKNKAGRYELHFDAEQTHNPKSRVFLIDERDAFGQKRLGVEWKYKESDALSAARSVELIGEEVRRTGVGVLLSPPSEIWERINKAGVGSHHIGLTRMSSDPADGVVDPDTKVHGVSNLYIASSSVFPTGSFANPTLMIVTLSLRLADHLKALRDT